MTENIYNIWRCRDWVGEAGISGSKIRDWCWSGFNRTSRLLAGIQRGQRVDFCLTIEGWHLWDRVQELSQCFSIWFLPWAKGSFTGQLTLFGLVFVCWPHRPAFNHCYCKAFSGWLFCDDVWFECQLKVNTFFNRLVYQKSTRKY